MTDFEEWYQQQIEKGILPDKDGYFHYSKGWEETLHERFIGAWSNITGCVKSNET